MGESDDIRAGSIGQRLCLLACLLLALPCLASAQTLARPGWAGSGLNSDPWWKQAVFYEIAPDPANTSHAAAFQQGADYKAITARLDALHSLGVDALILPMPRISASPTPDPSLDDFDELTDQASRRGIRVLLHFSLPKDTADLPALARFWLSRGVAGFHLVIPPETSPQFSTVITQTLRKITGSAVGARIVLTDLNPDASGNAPPAPAPQASSGRHAHTRRADHSADVSNSSAQFQIDSQLALLELPEASNIRPLLAQSMLTPNILLAFHPPAPPADSPAPYPALAKAMAAILLTTHSAALIDSSDDLVLQPSPPPAPDSPPPAPAPSTAIAYAVNLPISHSGLPRAANLLAPSLGDWYSKLSALHHGNATLRYGSAIMLNFDDRNALVWVIRPALGTGLAPPVVVVCNLTSSSLQVSLSTAIKSLNLRGSYLRTLLRSDDAIGAQNLNSVTLPPFAVYIGELHR
jgi:alpha-glucosidase